MCVYVCVCMYVYVCMCMCMVDLVWGINVIITIHDCTVEVYMYTCMYVYASRLVLYILDTVDTVL